MAEITDKTGQRRGREEIMTAILDAAESLLLVKSQNRISIREVAELAGVKHPLIHRHFGTKEKLITAVHARGVERVKEKLTEMDDLAGQATVFFQAIGENRFRQIAVARAMLDGVDIREIQSDFPVMNRLLDLLRKRHAAKGFKSPIAPELMAALLASAALGWFIHEPFLRLTIGLEHIDSNELNKQVAAILDEIVDKMC